MRERDGVLGLPMIVNRKTVDPATRPRPAVIQLETAMGAAIGVFDGARALRVPRTRFAPVKTTSDLLVLRSDAYVLDERRARRRWRPAREGAPPPLVELDPALYKLVRDFDARFPQGAPSLVDVRALTVTGTCASARDVVVRGEVTVEAGDARA